MSELDAPPQRQNNVLLCLRSADANTMVRLCDVLMALSAADAKVRVHLTESAAMLAGNVYGFWTKLTSMQKKYINKIGYDSLEQWYQDVSTFAVVSVCPTWANAAGIDPEEIDQSLIAVRGTPMVFAEAVAQDAMIIELG